MRTTEQGALAGSRVTLVLACALSGLIPKGAGATVVHEQAVAGGSSGSASVATASAVTAAGGNLYLAAIATKAGGVSVRSVSGLGLAWSLVRAQCAGRNQTRAEVWRGAGTPAASGVVSATLSGAASNAVIEVSRYSGADGVAPIGNVVSANTTGANGACGGGVDSAAYSVSLTTSLPEAVAYGAVAMRNRTHTPGSGYTERLEKLQGSGGNAAGAATMDRTVTSASAVPVNGTFSGNVDWAVVALEIRPGGGANRAPVAQDQSVNVFLDTARTILLTATDPDGDPLSYGVITQPLHGLLTGSAPNLTYTPGPGYLGADSFTFHASDGQADSNAAAVSITVTSGSSVLDAKVAHALDFAASRLDFTSRSIDATDYPFSASGTSWNLDSASSWGSGFFPGALWWMHERSGESLWRTRAEAWTAGLESQKTRTDTHDVGFIIYNSFGRGYGLTGYGTYAQVARTAAGALATRYSPVVGCTRSWDGSNFTVIIDNMMNLELLFWAARNGGDPAYYDMARSHAEKTMLNHVRPDGSTYHVVEYSESTGAVVRKRTAQGYSNGSTWSRGQAWAVYGFAMAYRETGDQRFLETAGRAADYFLSHLPTDHVPLWDFDVPPTDPRQYKDSSAAAIAASGLLELCRYAALPEDRERYRQGAADILDALTSPAYLSEGTSSPAVLLHGARNVPSNGDVDNGLIWGDYYFIEALRRYQALEAPQPGVSFSAASSSLTESGGTAQLAAGLSAKSALPVAVDYVATGGTATSGTDYAPAAGALIFDPGQTAKSIGIRVFDDTLVEGNETVEVTLGYAVGAVPGPVTSHVLTILDNDTGTSLPLPPANLTATAGNSQVALAWNASSGAASYSVKRSTTAGSGYSEIASGVAAMSYTDTGVTNGATYYYVVTAVNDAGESGASNEAVATPAQGGTGVVAFEEVQGGGSSSSATVATAAALTGAANHLYLAAIATRTGSVSVRSVGGLGLAWTLVRAQCAGRNQTRLEVWMALGAPTGSGVVTATLSASASNAVIEVSRYSGVNAAAPLGNVVSANTMGGGSACGGGVDSASYAVGLTTGAPNAVVYGAVAMRNRSHTPGAGYTERAEKMQGSGGEVAGTAVMDRPVPSPSAAPVNGIFSSAVDWAVVGIELRP